VVPIRNTPPANARRPRPRTRPTEEAASPAQVAVYQQTFDWNIPVNRRVQAPREAVRYCDAPVATPMHRAAAAALDYAIVSIAVGVLVTMLYLVAPELVNFAAAPYIAGLAGFCGFAYKLLWVLAETDSPGLRWTQLRTLNFDGINPTRNERLARVAAGCLSVLAGGLGLIWATADEETLSWHDHMSKTFLTPRIDPQFQ
jgi:uncharacterized RDD family membrane protein YckC